jgi:hypothetical protein
VFASSSEKTTSKAERKRILEASYSSRKDTRRRLLYSMGDSEKMRGNSLTTSE